MCSCTNRSQDQPTNIKTRRYHDYQPRAAQAHKLRQYSSPAQTHTHGYCKLVLYDSSSFATSLLLSA